MDLPHTLHRCLDLATSPQRRLQRLRSAVAALELPPPVFKTCPWQPREVVETGLRQWLLCCGAALGHRRVIGMPSRAVDEAWHGLILCTATYSAFCDQAYGRYLHHHPEGATPTHIPGAADPMHEQLGRTVVAWSLVAKPDEECVLWDLNRRVGVEQPWGVDLARVSSVQTAVAEIAAGRRSLR